MCLNRHFFLNVPLIKMKTSTTRSDTNLSNEAQAAMRRLYLNWTQGTVNLLDAIIVDETQIQQDNSGFSSQPVILKKGIDWRWNKTSVLRNLPLTSNTSVTLCKMQSRSKVAGKKPPSLKVWLYTIQTTSSPFPVYYYWVERGWALPSLEEFSFLSGFVAEDLAKEFNWL